MTILSKVLSEVKTLIEYAKCGMGYSQVINNEENASVVFPKSVKSLYNWNCPNNVTSVESQYITALPDKKFQDKYIKRAIFPKLETLPFQVFSRLKNQLEEVDFTSVTATKEGAFYQSSMKGDLIFPNLTSIQALSFWGFSIGDDNTFEAPKVENLGSNALKSLLVSVIKLPNCHTLNGGSLSDCIGTRRVEVGTLKSMSTTTFNDGMAAMEEFIVGEGTTSSIYVQSLEWLTQECLHNIIDNYANMNGATSPTFNMGIANLEKVSDEYKAKAVSKNITLK